MKKLRVGDTVEVIAGKNKGTQGKITALNFDTHKVTVEGVNVVKKAQKPNEQFGIAGGMYEFEKPVSLSNVQLVMNGEKTRVRIEQDEKTGKKVRVSTKTGKPID